LAIENSLGEMDEVRQKYQKFIVRHNGLPPQVVLADVEWKDTAEQNEFIMSLDDTWGDDTPYMFRNTDLGQLREDAIFFHLGSVGNLYKLLEKSAEDFVINHIIDFY